MNRSTIVNAMTIDVEDYFHVSVFDGLDSAHAWNTLESRVEANTERLLEILAEHDVRATFFVLGWVAERQPALVRASWRRGHEVASHGYGHRLVYDQTPASLPRRRAARQVAARTGGWRGGQRLPRAKLLHRAPFAVGARRADRRRPHLRREHLSQFGTTAMAFRFRRGTRTSLTGVKGRLIEVPASTAQVCGTNLPIAGGGYFRLLPYAWTRWGIRRVNRPEGRPAIFYLHPWEIDPDQPRLPAGMLSRVRHYRNLNQTESRLRRLLKDFAWGSLRSILPFFSDQAVPHGAPVALPYQW